MEGICDMIMETIYRGNYFALKKILESTGKSKLKKDDKSIKYQILAALSYSENSIAILLLTNAFKNGQTSPKDYDEFREAAEKSNSVYFLEILKHIKAGSSIDKYQFMIDEIDEDEKRLLKSKLYTTLDEATLLVCNSTSDVTDKMFNTLLHTCALVSDTTLPYAYSLLGVPPNAQNKEGDTPLHLAAREGNMDMCICFLQIGCNPLLKNKLALTALDLAQQRGDLPLVELLKRHEPGLTTGIAKGDHRAVVHALRRWVIPIGLDTDAINSAPDATRRAISSVTDTLLFVHRVLANDTRGVKRLLRNPKPGVNINVNIVHCDSGMTPLSAAVRNHNEVLVKELLRSGAEANIRVDSCPLTVQAIVHGSPLSLVLHLLAGNPQTWKERDSEGCTPAIRALKEGRTSWEIGCLLQTTRGLVMMERTPQGQCLREYANSLGRQDLECEFQVELSRLFKKPSKATKHIVMELAVNFLGRNNFCLDRSPGPLYDKFMMKLATIERRGEELMEAVEAGDLQRVKTLNDAPYTDMNGWTALTRAIVYDKLEVVEWLLGERPELRLVRDLNNRTALHFAYALPEEIGGKYVRLILARNSHEVENLPDKDGIIACEYRNLRESQEILTAIDKVRLLDPYGLPKKMQT